MRRNKQVQCEETISEILDYVSDLEELKDEMTEWRDNIEGTALENTAKYQEVSDAADTLENAHDSLEDSCRELKDELSQEILEVKVKYIESHKYGRKPMPRWMRLNNFTTAMSAVVEYLQGLSQYENNQSISDIDNNLSDLQGVDFPGMY